LKSPKDPKVSLIAAAMSPVGSPPAFGAIIFQNSEWL
jgi:hypothetical protein